MLPPGKYFIMTYKECCEVFEITDITFLPSAIMTLITGDTNKRDETYRKLLAINDYDMGRDWFQEIFESELSEGKRKGQHFTPPEIYSLISQLAGTRTGVTHEPTAGNGGLIIGDWHRTLMTYTPYDYFPSEHPYVAWELSDRSLPILLLNLSIRGIVGTVYHGDVLENTIIAKYNVINRTDDALGFSDVKIDHNKS